jgi:hypothetical protein
LPTANGYEQFSSTISYLNNEVDDSATILLDILNDSALIIAFVGFNTGLKKKFLNILAHIPNVTNI